MIPHNILGNFSAFLAAIMFGASVVATRMAVQDIPPLNLAVLRFGQGALILLLLLFIGARDLLAVKRRDLPYLILLGVVLFTVFPVTFNVGLKFTEASRGALILATMPIWSAWLARLAVRERLNFRQVAGILLTFAGVGMILADRGLHWRGHALALVGDGFMLLTALCGAVYGVLAKRMLRSYSAVTVTTYAMVFGTLLLFPATFLEGLPYELFHMGARLAVLVLFLGIFGGAVGYFLWTYALTRLSPTQVAVYVNINPLVATVLGVVLLAEKLTGVFLIGFVLIMAGVLFVNWPRRIRAEQRVSAGVGREL